MEREETMESTQREVAGAAGGINHPHNLVAERFDGRRERAVENELFDELRGLQQSEAFLGVFGKVLVEVAQETGVEIRIAEVVGERRVLQILPRFGVELLPEFQQQLRAVAAQPEAPDRIVSIVKEGRQTGQPANGAENVVEILAVTLGRVLAEVNRMLVAGQCQPRAGTGKIGGVSQQAVVFEETNEDAGENPRHRCLGKLRFAPGLVGFSGPFGCAGSLILGTKGSLDLGSLRTPRPQVILELHQEFLEVVEESRSVDHRDI